MVHEYIFTPIPLLQLRGVFTNEVRLIAEGIPVAFVFYR